MNEEMFQSIEDVSLLRKLHYFIHHPTRGIHRIITGKIERPPDKDCPFVTINSGNYEIACQCNNERVIIDTSKCARLIWDQHIFSFEYFILEICDSKQFVIAYEDDFTFMRKRDRKKLKRKKRLIIFPGMYAFYRSDEMIVFHQEYHGQNRGSRTDFDGNVEIFIEVDLDGEKRWIIVGEEDYYTPIMCAWCREYATKRCTNCDTSYCSRKCQKLDWKNGHKELCGQ